MNTTYQSTEHHLSTDSSLCSNKSIKGAPRIIGDLVANLRGRDRPIVGVTHRQAPLSCLFCRKSDLINLPTTDWMGNSHVDISSPGWIINVRVEVAVWLEKM